MLVGTVRTRGGITESIVSLIQRAIAMNALRSLRMILASRLRPEGGPRRQVTWGQLCCASLQRIPVQSSTKGPGKVGSPRWGSPATAGQAGSPCGIGQMHVTFWASQSAKAGLGGSSQFLSSNGWRPHESMTLTSTISSRASVPAGALAYHGPRRDRLEGRWSSSTFLCRSTPC